MRRAVLFALPVLLLAAPMAEAAPPAEAAPLDVTKVYTEHCAPCHGPDRLGAIGPALLPENLKRLRKKKAAKVIKHGLHQTQMEGFAEKLDDAQVAALVEYIYTPLANVPDWGAKEALESLVVHTPLSELPDAPQHSADPMNLFTVVEAGDHHVTILDGDEFEPLWRFQSRFALHGGAKYSPDGRFVYLASRDGWVSMYDLHSFQPVAEIRAGINTRNIAVSSDGKWIAVGNFLPHNIFILDALTLKPFKVIPVDDGKGNTSRVSAVYNAPPRKSFVAALKDIKEVWELSYDPEAEPIYGNFTHTFRKGAQNEAVVVEEQPFARRRIQLDTYLDDFFFDPYYAEVFGAARDGKHGVVWNLDARKKVADLELGGLPHLGSGIVFDYQGRPMMATPHLKEAAISVIDMESWKTEKKIATKGPGFFMRGHENSPYAWTDVFFGKHRDLLHVIDTRTLEIVRDINPAPGKVNAHVEFTKDGRYALVSVWDMDGALVVYDAATFEEVKRIPMKKPVGKYNVWNKITYSKGTSH